MNWRGTDSEWFYYVRLCLKVSIVIAALYVGYHFYERQRIAGTSGRSEPQEIKLPEDVFAFIPKSYVTDLESARRKLVGQPLWVKEGYRWTYAPGDRLFRPIERVVPREVKVQAGEVRLVFEKDGREAWVTIGTPERVFVDEIFFVKDPREIYDHWTDEMWRKAQNGAAEVGMTEIQIGFALGVGEVVRQSPGGATRVVDYKQCREAGLDPVRVTYKRYVAADIEPLDP